MNVICNQLVFFHFHFASCLGWIVLHQQIRISSHSINCKLIKVTLGIYVQVSHIKYDLPAWHMMTLTSLGSKIPVLWLAPPSASLATNIVWGSICNKDFFNFRISKHIHSTNQIKIRYYSNWNFSIRKKTNLLHALCKNFLQNPIFIKIKA